MAVSSAASGARRFAPWLILALLWSAAGLGQVITVFDVWATDGIVSGPDGAMWFTNLSYNTIGRIDLNGAVTTFPVASSRYPTGIATGPDGNLWFTESGMPGRIGRISTAGVITEFALPTAASRPYGIVAGPDGNLWFTEPGINAIGRITTTGSVVEFPVPTPAAALAGIASGPDGNLWFVESAGNKIGRITTSGTVAEFALPTADSRPTAIAAGPDGNLWFTERFAPRVGRITPTGEITEFPLPGTDGSAGVVAGSDGNLWFTSTGLGFNHSGTGELRRVTTGGEVTLYPAPLVGPSPLGIAVSLEGDFWITDNVNGFGAQIVRFALRDTAPCATDSTTLCLNGGRFRVTADWKKRDGSTGHGHGVALTPNSGYFWFFDDTNIEVVTKVLDGCSGSQHYWTFAAGLTNVEVTLIVTDTFAGVTRTYTNPQGSPFVPVQDTSAFATCP